MVFFQTDVAVFANYFTRMFDAAFCSLAFHHNTDLIAYTREMHHILRPGGYVIVVDPDLAWFKHLSEWIAPWASPGWTGFS
jgi:SAM-dependent methyltransferase